MKYVVVDIETTGLSKSYHKITELAAVKINNNRITESFQTLVNPETRIPGFITKLTGIDNNMVKDAPVIKKALPDFAAFLEGNTFVAHNASFDHGFISYNMEKYAVGNVDKEKICTRRLANRLVPELPSKKLANLCSHFNIPNTNAHRALSDAIATAGVFNKFLDTLKKYDIHHPHEIAKLQSIPKAKVPLFLQK